MTNDINLQKPKKIIKNPEYKSNYSVWKKNANIQDTDLKYLEWGKERLRKIKEEQELKKVANGI